MSRWSPLGRYEAGQHQRVWAELLLGGRDDQARAIVAETMRRARHNVEVLVARLPELGYRFERPDAAHVPPPAGLGERLDELERHVGVLPLAFRAFAEQVGSVDLVGAHPEWSCRKPDPLQVELDPDYVRSEFDLHVEDGRTDQFLVEFSADDILKAGYSGGRPYGIAVPNPGVDGLVYGEWHQTTFTNLLRIAFRRAGFAGWHGEPLPAELRALTAELVPL